MRITFLFVLVGCAASRPAGPLPMAAPSREAVTLDPARRLIDLSPAERAALCDWSASMVGGYGRTYACGTSIHQTFPSRDACVESRSKVARSCEATVGDSQACTRAARGDVCVSMTPGLLPECGGRLAGCKTPPPVQHPFPPVPTLSLANRPLEWTALARPPLNGSIVGRTR
jgi:hypothetical protein